MVANAKGRYSRGSSETLLDQEVAIALDHTGVQHRLQFHHIFPKAVLKSSYTGREADDIANLCFIAGKTNRQDPELPGVDGYKAFLQRRREAVARRLNAFLGA